MRLVRPILAALRSRPAVAVLLVYQALFLNVFLPGHARGAITLDGKHATAACCCCGTAAESRPDGKGPAVPSERDREHCAVCQFVAGLTSVPVVRLTIHGAGLLDLLPVPPPAVVAARNLIPTYHACGPPPSLAHV